MIEILFVQGMHPEEKNVIDEIRKAGCNVTIYKFNIQLDEELQVEYSKLVMFLRKKTYHIMCSVNFDEILANAGYVSGTKYVSFQYDVSENALSSIYANYVTNYIIVNELLPYIQFRKKRVETVYYCSFDMNEILANVISDEELDIYKTILELEDFRRQDGNMVKSNKREDVYESYGREKEFLLRLKEQCGNYFDSLMSKRNCTAWEEMFVWFNRNVAKELDKHFWEFYVLRIMVQVYREEREAAERTGKELSVLQFGSRQELFDTYFKMIFLLRRLEYDVDIESHMEAVIFIKKYSLSDIFMKFIFEKGQIDNKEKVIIKLKKLWQEYDNE